MMIFSVNSRLRSVMVFLVFVGILVHSSSADADFNDNYNVTWGHDHALLLNNGREIQLTLDKTSGAGFESKYHYRYGLFHMRLKIPAKNSAGVVTTFYLTSRSNKRDELDFEFLGNSRPPYLLHTNVITNGQGGREQRIKLWFDPTKDFHSYKILWNPYQVVFYVDNIPIRVFKNTTNLGVMYPTQPMQVVASIWDASAWASHGKPIDWTQAPFQANYRDFDIDGCRLQLPNNNIDQCRAPSFPWYQFRRLSFKEQKVYETVRRRLLKYDYCSDRKNHPQRPPECQTNQ